jgi:hypothetical protein
MRRVRGVDDNALVGKEGTETEIVTTDMDSIRARVQTQREKECEQQGNLLVRQGLSSAQILRRFGSVQEFARQLELFLSNSEEYSHFAKRVFRRIEKARESLMWLRAEAEAESFRERRSDEYDYYNNYGDRDRYNDDDINSDFDSHNNKKKKRRGRGRGGTKYDISSSSSVGDGDRDRDTYVDSDDVESHEDGHGHRHEYDDQQSSNLMDLLDGSDNQSHSQSSDTDTDTDSYSHGYTSYSERGSYAQQQGEGREPYTIRFSELYSMFHLRATMGDSGRYFLCDLEERIALAKTIDDVPMTLRNRYTFCMAPVDSDNDQVMAKFKKFANDFSKKGRVRLRESVAYTRLPRTPLEVSIRIILSNIIT